MFGVEEHARLVDSERKLGEITPPRGFSPEREGPAVRIEPGKEQDFRCLRGWLASSEWLDRLIAATEPEAAANAGPVQAGQARREGKDQMFSILDETTIQAVVTIREDEVRRLMTEGEARRKERASEPRVWRWCVEPGMEETFEDLRGWLLPSERHAPVEITALGRGNHARPADRTHSMSAEVRCRRQRTTFRFRLPWMLAGARLPTRAILRMSRRLLQWEDGTRLRGRTSSKLQE